MASSTNAKELIDAVSCLLEDVGAITWGESELIEWLNLSQVEIVNLSPSANVKNLAVKLISGVKQALPADGILLLDIPYNYKANGTHISSTINAVPKDIMNKRLPGWVTAAPSQTVKHFVYTPSDPKIFYVYPAQPTLTTYVELVYSAYPEYVPNTEIGTKITIPDHYKNILLNMIMAKALSKDGEFGNNLMKAKEYRLLAEQELGISSQPSQSQSQAQQPQPQK